MTGNKLKWKYEGQLFPHVPWIELASSVRKHKSSCNYFVCSLCVMMQRWLWMIIIKAEVCLKIYFYSDSWTFAPPAEAWWYKKELLKKYIFFYIILIYKKCLLKTRTVTVCISVLKQQPFSHRVPVWQVCNLATWWGELFWINTLGDLSACLHVVIIVTKTTNLNKVPKCIFKTKPHGSLMPGDISFLKVSWIFSAI